MWEPRRLTNLRASTAFFRDSCGRTIFSRVLTLHHWDTLFTGLLNSLKKQVVCAINVCRRSHGVCIHTQEFVGEARSRKCVGRVARQIGVSTSTEWKEFVMMTCCFRIKCNWDSHFGWDGALLLGKDRSDALNVPPSSDKAHLHFDWLTANVVRNLSIYYTYPEKVTAWGLTVPLDV
jgi:hypothetical protein